MYHLPGEPSARQEGGTYENSRYAVRAVSPDQWDSGDPNPSVLGRGWISGTEADAAPWFSDIEQELLKKKYAVLHASDPRTPQVVVLRKFNQAAKAYQASEHALAQELVQDTLDVFEDGVRKHYYTHAQIDHLRPIF